MQVIEGIGTFDAAVERKSMESKKTDYLSTRARVEEALKQTKELLSADMIKDYLQEPYTRVYKALIGLLYIGRAERVAIDGTYFYALVPEKEISLPTFDSAISDKKVISHKQEPIMKTNTQRLVVNALSMAKKPMNAKELALQLKTKEANVWGILAKLSKKGLLNKEGKGSRVNPFCYSVSTEKISFELKSIEKIMEETMPAPYEFGIPNRVINTLITSDTAMSANELQAQLKVPLNSIWPVLTKLSKSGIINKEGEGVINSPFCYSINTEPKENSNPVEIEDGCKYQKANKELAKSRILANIDKNEKGCWLWTGPVNRNLPVICVGGIHMQARPLSYLVYKGVLAKGVVRLTCGIPICVNPAHFVDENATEPIRTNLVPAEEVKAEPVQTRKEFVDSITIPQPVPNVINFWKKEYNDFSLLYEGDVLENLVNIETSSSSYINLDPPFMYDRTLFPDWINKIAIEANRIATPECNLSIVLPDDMLDIAMDKFKARGWKFRNLISLQKCNIARDKKRDESPKNDGKMGQAAFFCGLMYKGDIEKVYFKKLGNVKVYENSHVCDECGNKQNREVWLGGNVWSHTAGHRIDGHCHREAMPEYQTHALIEMLSQDGDLVLDVFNGSGNMMIYCMFNNRGCIGIELDPEAIKHYYIRLDKKLKEQRQRYERKSR